MRLTFRKRFRAQTLGLACPFLVGLLFVGPAAPITSATDTKVLRKELEEATSEAESPNDAQEADEPQQSESSSESETQPPANEQPAETKPPLEKEPVPEAKSATQSKPATFLSYQEVEQVVARQLQSIENYQSGDLLTASSVSPVFKQLEGAGWKVLDRKEIEKLFLPDNDWLVRQFRTKNGRKFMREIGRNPGGFDRVDRMRKMPYGERQLSDLIQKPDGSKMIEYMVTTPGGKNLGNKLSRGKNGGNFNESTGRLYVEKQLLERLKQSHEAELRRRGLTS